jgi:hypothetical protein
MTLASPFLFAGWQITSVSSSQLIACDAWPNRAVEEAHRLG